jgi:hypothetical protein
MDAISLENDLREHECRSLLPRRVWLCFSLKGKVYGPLVKILKGQKCSKI